MKRVLVAILMCLASAIVFADGWRDLWLRRDQQAQALLQSGKPAEAAALFDDPRHRAYAELKAQKFVDAAKRLAPLKDAQSQYNRGNALAHAGDLKNALAAYDAALAQAPNDRDARHNRDLVAKQLEKQENKAQQRNQSGQSGKNQNGGQQEQNRQAQNQQQKQSQQANGNQGNNSQKNGSENKKDQGKNDQDKNDQDKNNQVNSRDAAANWASADKRGQAQQSKNAMQNATRDSAAEKAQAQADAAAALKQEPQRVSSEHARASREAAKPRSEQALAMDQWLRRIPDDPGGLLRRKFMIEHMLKQQEAQP